MQLAVELARELQELLSRYVNRAMPADELRAALDRLAPRLAELSDEQYASWAADHIDILFAEMDQDHRSEDEVRALIQSEILMPQVDVVMGSAAETATEAPTFESRNVIVVAA